MDRHARERQQRYLQKRKAAGFHRLEAWIPPDLVAEIDRRYGPYGDFCRPQRALIALVRKALLEAEQQAHAAGQPARAVVAGRAAGPGGVRRLAVVSLIVEV